MTYLYMNKEMPEWMKSKIESDREEAKKCRKDLSDGPCNAEKEIVTLKKAPKGQAETLVNERVIKRDGAILALEEYTKDIQREEGVSYAVALDKACKRYPELVNQYESNKAEEVQVGKSAKDEIMKLISEIQRLTQCNMERAAHIVSHKYPDLYRRYSEEVMNKK